ncbi:thiamine-phosphate kinase [bacterium]|nr:thiamine-phosphate kinase [bacterium]
MALSEQGEFNIIRQMHRVLGAASADVYLGIGDDAAVLNVKPEHQILLTADALVEGVHFNRSYTPLDALGWKSLAASISDIAAMGGRPEAAIVSLAVDDTWSIDDITMLYTGLKECALNYNCRIAGGDTTRSLSGAFINITLMGVVKTGLAVTRKGARSGDLIGLSGPIGSARCGLEILESSCIHEYPLSVEAFLKPVPSVDLGLWLAKELNVTSMIDISDGLSSELHHLCDASNTGCQIELANIPVTDEVKTWALSNNFDPVDIVMNSGEEYCLLFTCNADHAQIFKSSMPPKPIHFIGTMTDEVECRTVITPAGKQTLERSGWDHFTN